MVNGVRDDGSIKRSESEFNKAFGQQTVFATRRIKGAANAVNLTRRRRRSARPTIEAKMDNRRVLRQHGEHQQFVRVDCGDMLPTIADSQSATPGDVDVQPLPYRRPGRGSATM